MKASDIMTPNVVCAKPDSSVPEVARLMCDNDCGAIPVLDMRGHPVGIVTDRDISCRVVAAGKDPIRTEVREIMSESVVAVGPEASVEECCEVLEKNQLRRLLVV